MASTTTANSNADNGTENHGITLSAPGKRARVSVAEAQAIVDDWKAQLLNNSEAVTQLSLSCRAWPWETLQVMVPFFQEHNVAAHLQVLDWDDGMASLPTDDGLATLTGLGQTFETAQNMHTLRFNDNATGIRGILAIEPLLRLPNLQHVHLQNNGLSAEVGQVLREWWVVPKENDSEKNTNIISLKTMDAGRNQMGPVGAQHVGAIVAHMPELEHFGYAGSRPLVEGTRALTQGLADLSTLNNNNLNHLIHLDLTDCHLQSGAEADDPVHNLAVCLQHAPKMQHLALADCNMQLGGLRIVLAALRTCQTTSNSSNSALHTLHLEANEIMAEGTQAVADFLPHVPGLQVLNLNANEILDPADDSENDNDSVTGSQALANLWKAWLAQPRHTLHLQSNLLEDCEDEWWTTDCSNTTSTTLCTTTTILDVQDNDLEESVVVALAEHAHVTQLVVDEELRDALPASNDGVDDLVQAMAGTKL